MIDVGSVIAFSVLNINFAANQFFGGNKFYIMVEQTSGVSLFKPLIIYFSIVVDGVENDVDEEFFFIIYFCKPSYVRQFGFEYKLIKILQKSRIICGAAVDIHIVGHSKNA